MKKSNPLDKGFGDPPATLAYPVIFARLPGYDPGSSDLEFEMLSIYTTDAFFVELVRVERTYVDLQSTAIEPSLLQFLLWVKDESRSHIRFFNHSCFTNRSASITGYNHHILVKKDGFEPTTRRLLPAALPD